MNHKQLWAAFDEYLGIEQEGMFTCNELQKVSKLLDSLGDYLLFSCEEDGMTPMAVQHLLKATREVQSAEHSAMLAYYEQLRG